METIGTKSKVISTKILYAGTTKRIIIKKYYDYHGQIIDQGTDTRDYLSDVKFSIVEKKSKLEFSYSDPLILDTWELHVNGKNVDLEVEITGYEIKKDKVILQGCVGAG